MKNSKVIPEDTTKFSAFYIDKYILNNKEELDTAFWNQYIELMKTYPDEDIKTGFYANISDLYLNNKLEESIKVLTALNTIKIGTDSDNETLLSLIEKIKSNTSLIEEKTIENEGIQGKIGDNLDEVEAQKLLLTDVTAQIETTNSGIEELKQKLSVKQNYSYLRYYCVTKHESGVYEIILPKNSNFFGEILSNTHAIIYTSDSTLTVNGWGDLNVYDNGYKTVTLKAYGNYKQDLMTYKEVSKSDFTEIDSIQATVDENNKTLATLNESKDTYTSKIKELEENNTALEEEKNTLLATLTTMKDDNSSIDSQIKELIKIK
jgi:predicted nuclease with TOPRIM domain